MKRSGTVLIFVIVWAAVLFASFVIGICVREVRFHRARTTVEVTKETETTTPKPKVVTKVERLSETEKLAQELAQKAPAPRPGGGERMANRPGGPGIEGGPGAGEGRKTEPRCVKEWAAGVEGAGIECKICPKKKEHK